MARNRQSGDSIEAQSNVEITSKHGGRMTFRETGPDGTTDTWIDSDTVVNLEDTR